MSKQLEKRVEEWGLWYHYNKDRIPPTHLEKRCAFYEKAIDGCIEILAIATKDIQELEGKKPGASLWLPKGMSMLGDPKEFG